MTSAWLQENAPPLVAGRDTVLMAGTTFCISDDRGDFAPPGPRGLFVRDTRMLHRWTLHVADRHLGHLRTHQSVPYAASFLLHAVAKPGSTLGDVLVRRERFVDEGLVEEITVINPSGSATAVRLRLDLDGDFSDVFEVKEGLVRAPDAVAVRPGKSSVDVIAERAKETYGVAVQGGEEARADTHGMEWHVTLPPHGRWRTTIQAFVEIRGERLTGLHQAPGPGSAHTTAALRHSAFRKDAPRLTTSDAALAQVLRHSIDDLSTLRIFDPSHPERPVVAAGAPWFMALFGRDSLLTSLMLLPVDTWLAFGTLRTLAEHMGQSEDPVTEEQPGRVPHELRFGPAGTLALGGRNVYYGSADATPLFVVALGQLLQWNPDLVTPDLVEAADRALTWMVEWGDRDGDGFIEYERSSERGLVNQGWKDSWDGINFADGRLAEAPIALAEVQAYAYAAYLARADIASWQQHHDVAERWRTKADALRAAFHQRFWLPERGWYAVGLDSAKVPIDALTSNIGHCLWAGIAEPEPALRVAQHLAGPDMFSGWGIRTLSSKMGRFDAMSYHNGSVWPHDTALCVSGLLRYGHVDAATRIAMGLLDAVAGFDGRPPELFAGVGRSEFPVPVPYPAACSPQAWAAAAPVELLRALLGLVPQADGLRCAPVVPERLLPIELERVACRGRPYDLRVDVSGVQLRASPQTVDPS